MYNWNPCIEERIYTKKLAEAIRKYDQNMPQHFVIDTGRAGVPGVRKVWGSWCNIIGAGIGPRPEYQPARWDPNMTQVDAYLWIKPPGTSDGISGPPGGARVDKFCIPHTKEGVDSMENAPQAGLWFQEHFVMLTRNANPTLWPPLDDTRNLSLSN